MIASAIDGRIRFRSALLRDEREADRIRQKLNAMAGVSHVSANPRTGSLLVEYMPSVLDQQAIVDASGLPAEEPAEQAPVRPRSTRQRNMRIAKRGMLASMAAMLLFAVTDREREHVVAGVAFLAFNAYHQYMYRRRLLA